MVAEAQHHTLLKPDTQAISAFLSRFMRPGEVYGVRIPDPRRGGPRRFYKVQAGAFEDAGALVAACSRITGLDAEAVYMTLNPIDPNFLSQARNKLKDVTSGDVTDADIVRRRHFLLDVDPERHPSKISATDEEVALAIALLERIVETLIREYGWPAPLAKTMSGNGGGAIYDIDLPNDDASEALVKHVLEALDARFSDERVSVDTSVFNAGRLTKIIGTVSAKGEDFTGHPTLRDRPHRLATAAYTDGTRLVSVAQLEAVAADAPEAESTERAHASSNGHARGWTMADVVKLNNLTASAIPYNGGTKFVLDHCLLNKEHTGSCAALFETGKGALAYLCLHKSCQGKDWAYLRAHGKIKLPAGAEAHTQQEQARQRDQDGEQAEGTVYIARSFAAVEEGSWDWGWGKRLAYGMVAVMGGDGGSGKTWTLVDLACRFSTGSALPGEAQTVQHAPCTVVFLNHEDDAERELKARIRACRGDTSRLYLWDGVRRQGQEDFPDLTRDLTAAEQLITDKGARVLLIDPLTGYLGKTKTSDESEVRRALMPLTRMARRLNVAVLGVMHPRKGEDMKAVNMLLGSVAFKNVARSVMLVGFDPTQQGRRVLLHEKSNNREPEPGLGFRIAEDGPHWDSDPVTCTAEEVFAPNTTQLKREQGNQLERACELLDSQLAGGRQPAETLYDEAEKQHGISRDALYRAKNKLRVLHEREGFGRGSVVYWRMPA